MLCAQSVLLAPVEANCGTLRPPDDARVQVRQIDIVQAFHVALTNNSLPISYSESSLLKREVNVVFLAGADNQHHHRAFGKGLP
jgi:hypothetical protein